MIQMGLQQEDTENILLTYIQRYEHISIVWIC